MSIDEGREYYVVFIDSDKPYLKRLKKGYRNCMIVRNDYNAVWTIIQDGYHFMDVSTYLVEEYPTVSKLIRTLYNEESVFIKSSRLIGDSYRGHICLFNCVEVCKAMLGLRKPFIFTPYQLYRYLLCRA